MWHTACSTLSRGEVVIFGGCETSILGPNIPVREDSRFSTLYVLTAVDVSSLVLGGN